MDTPREQYLAACTEIAETLHPLGFKFTPSGPHAQRQDEEFTYRVSFQSSRHNIAGDYVALWIHANVLSKRLKKWRVSQAHPLFISDGVAGGQIGNLVSPHSWRDWNIAGKSGASVLADAISTVKSIALPYFAQFADIPRVCQLLQNEELPAMGTPQAIEFLLCFADRTAADTALDRFFRSRPELLDDYHRYLLEFQSNGLPEVRRTGFAYELAFATLGYGLTPPT